MHTKKCIEGCPLVLYSYLNGPHFLSVEKRIQISLVWPFQPMGGITDTLILTLSFLSYRIDCKICYRSVPVFFSLFFSSSSSSLSLVGRGWSMVDLILYLFIYFKMWSQSYTIVITLRGHPFILLCYHQVQLIMTFFHFVPLELATSFSVLCQLFVVPFASPSFI